MAHSAYTNFFSLSLWNEGLISFSRGGVYPQNWGSWGQCPLAMEPEGAPTTNFKRIRRNSCSEAPHMQWSHRFIKQLFLHTEMSLKAFECGNGIICQISLKFQPQCSNQNAADHIMQSSQRCVQAYISQHSFKNFLNISLCFGYVSSSRLCHCCAQTYGYKCSYVHLFAEHSYLFAWTVNAVKS